MLKTKHKFTYLPDGSLDIDAWLLKIQRDFKPEQLNVIQKAIDLAKSASKGLTTFYGQPCLEQSLETAEIIADLNLDPDAIAAAILTSTMQHTQLKLETITQTVGENITKLIMAINKLNVLHTLNYNDPIKNQIQADRLRKAFLAMAADIRVILIKLAERTCIMRGIKKINLTERKHYAQETVDIYAPLANRLGIGSLKWELEDLAFHYLNPDMYKQIADYLAERRTERQEKIQKILETLKTEFAKANINAKVSGRAKHIYSIYLKMQRKQLNFSSIYDYSAVRILVPTFQECYTALGIVHNLWEHIRDEFDDYISNPKPNGYRSIHTAVIDEDKKNFEIQIRTKDMHTEAEHGVAAHWIYKENKPQQSGYEAKITLLRQLLAWHNDIASTENKTDQPPEQILEDRVYVFSPAGEIMELPVGATSLDFAYHIHTELGHQCRGAKINGHIVPLTYALRMGDRVDIITNQHGTPSRDWLRKDSHYIKTARARAKVAQWFKHHDLEKQAETSKNTPEIKPVTPPHSQPISHPKKIIDRPRGFRVGNTNDLLTRIARCCKPIPGDQIIGFITQGRGVSIHKLLCPNITHATLDNGKRLIEVNWDEKQPGGYYADIQIRAYGREQILKEITSLLANTKIDLVMLNSTMSKVSNMTVISLTAQIHDILQLTQLMNQIKQLPHVIDVKRISE